MIGRGDPDVSVAMVEFTLMQEIGLRPWELDRLPAQTVAYYLAIAEEIGDRRQRDREKAEAEARFARGGR